MKVEEIAAWVLQIQDEEGHEDNSSRVSTIPFNWVIQIQDDDEDQDSMASTVPWNFVELWMQEVDDETIEAYKVILLEKV